MASAADRREFERFPAVGNRTRLEWWDGTDQYQISARLLNVSQGGALLETAASLPVRQAFWIRLEEPAPSAWVGARLVRHETAERAAVAFHQPCPYDFLESARLGISLDSLG